MGKSVSNTVDVNSLIAQPESDSNSVDVNSLIAEPVKKKEPTTPSSGAPQPSKDLSGGSQMPAKDLEFQSALNFTSPSKSEKAIKSFNAFNNYTNGKLTGDDVGILSESNVGKGLNLDKVKPQDRDIFANSYNTDYSKNKMLSEVNGLVKNLTPQVNATASYDKTFNPQELIPKVQQGDPTAIKTFRDKAIAGYQQQINALDNAPKVQKVSGRQAYYDVPDDVIEKKRNLQDQINKINQTFNDYGLLNLADKHLKLANNDVSKVEFKKIGQEYTNTFETPLSKQEQLARKSQTPEGEAARQNIDYRNAQLGITAVRNATNFSASSNLVKGLPTGDKNLLSAAEKDALNLRQLDGIEQGLKNQYPSVGKNLASRYVGQIIAGDKELSRDFVNTAKVKAAVDQIKTTNPDVYSSYKSSFDYLVSHPEAVSENGVYAGFGRGVNDIGAGIRNLKLFGLQFKSDENIAADEINRQSRADLKGTDEPTKIVYDKSGKAFREVENENYSPFSWNNITNNIGQQIPGLLQWYALSEATGGLAAGIGKAADVGIGIEALMTDEQIAQRSATALQQAQQIKHWVGNLSTATILDYGKNYQYADELVKDNSTAGEFKKNAAATLLTMGTGFAMSFLPLNESMQRSFQNSAGKELVDLVAKKGTQSLTKDEFYNWWQSSAQPRLQAIAKSVGGNVLKSAEFSSAQAMNEKFKDFISVALNPQAKTSSAQDNIKTFVGNFLPAFVLGMPEMAKDGISNGSHRDILYHIAQFPDEYTQEINESLKRGDINQKQANEMITVAKTLGEAVGKSNTTTNDGGLPLTARQHRDIVVNNFRAAMAKGLEDAGHRVDAKAVAADAEAENKNVLKENYHTDIEDSETFKQISGINANVNKLSDIDPNKEYNHINEQGDNVMVKGADLLKMLSEKEDLNQVNIDPKKETEYSIEAARKAEIRKEFGFDFHEELAKNGEFEWIKEQSSDFLKDPKAYFEKAIETAKYNLERDPNNPISKDVLEHNTEELKKWNEINDRYDNLLNKHKEFLSSQKTKNENQEAKEAEKANDVVPQSGKGEPGATDKGDAEAPVYRKNIRDDYFAKQDFFTPEEKDKFKTLDEAGQDKMIDDKRAELAGKEKDPNTITNADFKAFKDPREAYHLFSNGDKVEFFADGEKKTGEWKDHRIITEDGTKHSPLKILNTEDGYIKKADEVANKESVPSVEDKKFTNADVINKGYADLKDKIGEKKAKKYFEQADRLINPNENNIVEYRENGIVTKDGDKYTFHALADTDLKNWRIAFKTDVTDQFAKNETAKETKLPIPKEEAGTTNTEPIENSQTASQPKERVISYDTPEKIKGYAPDTIMHFNQGVNNNRVTLIVDPEVKSDYSEQLAKAKKIGGKNTSFFKHILKDIAKNYRDSEGADKIVDLRGIDLKQPLSEIIKSIEAKTENQETKLPIPKEEAGTTNEGADETGKATGQNQNEINIGNTQYFTRDIDGEIVHYKKEGNAPAEMVDKKVYEEAADTQSEIKDLEKSIEEIDKNIATGKLTDKAKERAEKNKERYEKQIRELKGETPPPPETPVTEDKGDNAVGVSHAKLTELATRLGLKEPQRGQFLEPKWYAERGRQLLANGADPAEALNLANELHDRISIARAHLENLVRDVDDIARSRGIESDEYQNAENKVNDYSNNVVKKLGTLAHRAFESLQGQRDLNTDSFTAVRLQVKDNTGKDLTAAQEQKIKDLTDENNRLKKEFEDANAKLVKETDKEIGKTKSKPKPERTIKEKSKIIADAIRKGKLSRPDTFSSATPASLVWDLAIETAAKTVEVSGDLAQAVSDGIKKIKASEWYKGLSEEKKKKAENEFTDFVNAQNENELTPEEKNIKRLEKELEKLKAGDAKQSAPKREPSVREKELQEQIRDEKEKLGLTPSKGKKPLTDEEIVQQHEEEVNTLQTQFANKTDNKFTPEEAKSIWDYAKRNYLDQGVSYMDMVGDVSNDIGLSTRQVYEALTTPKTKEISLNAWKKQRDYRRSQEATKNWVDDQNKHPYLKAFKKVSDAFRGLAVFGHGGIFIGTHAAPTLFQPSTWKYTIPAFFNGWKYAYGNQIHYDLAMRELKNRENYTIAQRSGLKNDPDRLNVEEYQKSQHFLGKLGMAGEKGFNAIKVLRQDLFDWHYNKLSSAEKADPQSAKNIAELINNATGATNLNLPKWVNEVTFAGGMEASRWGRLTRNPLKATDVALKAIISPSKVSAADRVFAKVWARRVGEQLGTYATLLAVNAAIQGMVNPKNAVNITNPSQSDWLKFKFGDFTLDPTSGILGVMRFMEGLAHIPFESKKERHGDNPFVAGGKKFTGYVRGKLSPFYGTFADLYSGQDFYGNTLPYNEDKPQKGREQLNWLQYGYEKLPLPLAEGIENVNQGLKDAGTSEEQRNAIIKGVITSLISGGTGFRVSDYQPVQPKTGN